MSGLRKRGKKGSGNSGKLLSGLAGTLAGLRKRKYGSHSEYYGKVSAAASAFGNVAAGVVALEAAHLAQRRSPHHPRHRTVEVSPGAGGDDDFGKIQSAIDMASPGDRVLLKKGIYRASGALWVWKDLVIEGEQGAVIEGTLDQGGKAFADPAMNGGFMVVNNASAEIRNIHFRLLYFAAASLGGFSSIVFEDNICEDVYHSVYATSAPGFMPSLHARANRIIVNSLDHFSAKCRLNFYDESHLFGFYCSGGMRAVIEANHIEVRELAARTQFHAIGVVCADGCRALVRDNFIKGWHSAVSVHDSKSPVLAGNEIHGLCEDAEYRPIGIFLRNCPEPAVVMNRIMNRGLGSGTVGIAISNTKGGRILDNRMELQKDAEAGILVFKSDENVIGQNAIGSNLACPIGLFGDQSEDAKHNLLFGNSIEGKADVRMCYASDNTILGQKGERSAEQNNAVFGYGIEFSGFVPSQLDKEDFERRQRVEDHCGRKVWPAMPERYSRS